MEAAQAAELQMNNMHTSGATYNLFMAMQVAFALSKNKRFRLIMVG
jgi:hypothetical protein